MSVQSKSHPGGHSVSIDKERKAKRHDRAHRIEVERADNGGFIATTHSRGYDSNDQPVYERPPQSVHKNYAELESHLRKHFGDEAESKEKE